MRRRFPSRIRSFCTEDSGAVTVDWTVMSAAIVGLGIATYGVVSGGVSDLSGDVDSQMRGQVIRTSFGGPIAAMDFTDGARGGWIGGTILSPLTGLGEMLVLGPRETANVTLDVPPGSTQATLSFDLIGGDSLDGEIATITTNGRTVTLARGDYSAPEKMTFTTPDLEGVTVRTELIQQGNLGGSGPARWQDSVTRVSITLDDPGDTLALGMTSGANSAITDEFFGIDNVDVSAR